MDDEAARLEALARARVFADPRKFREYVLVPGHATGKDGIFLELLGFRPRNGADAWALARLFETQARERIAAGDVRFARMSEFGTLCTIVGVVRGVTMRSAWLLSDDLVLRLVTPFSGFARNLPEN